MYEKIDPGIRSRLEASAKAAEESPFACSLQSFVLANIGDLESLWAQGATGADLARVLERCGWRPVPDGAVVRTALARARAQQGCAASNLVDDEPKRGAVCGAPSPANNGPSAAGVVAAASHNAFPPLRRTVKVRTRTAGILGDAT